MIVMEALGRVLALEPYLATVVLAGTALGHAGSTGQNETIVPQIVDGSLRLAVAHGERQARYDLADVMTTATKKAGGWRLSWSLSDRKSTRLNSSHQIISYAVFCLKKKKHK